MAIDDKPRATTDMENIRIGFDILAKYDNTDGDVSMNYERTIFAGPEEFPPEKMHPEDQAILARYGWRYDEDIERWGFR